jgi:uncharacterized protein YecE (DUF72 family)
MAAKILVGTCSWAEKSLVGSFYPKDIRPAEMISYYSAQFPVVEVDSSFYHMPTARNASLWAERTPQDFRFDYKAFGPMTTHNGEYRGEKVKRATEDMLREFEDAMAPLAEQRRLGYVLFQFPKWFFPSPQNRDYIAWCVEHMPNSLVAVEFRNGYWLKDEERTLETREFLSGIGAAYVSVDEPQVDIKSSAPPVDMVTTRDISVFRLHGRKTATWDLRGATVEQRFDYNYSSEDLEADIAPRILKLAQEPVAEVHVMFNNIHHGYGPSNAQNLIALLRQLEMDVVMPSDARDRGPTQSQLSFE